MIYFDTTKSAATSHRSGLMRVSDRLRHALGADAVSVRWPDLPRDQKAEDWFVTAELFSEPERPGFTAWLESHRCRTAAIFHDAIPLQLPHITWPQSVARHPSYLKLLATFDRVFAVSQASKADLEGFWRWQGLERMPPVDVLALGADFIAGEPRRGMATSDSGSASRPQAGRQPAAAHASAGAIDANGGERQTHGSKLPTYGKAAGHHPMLLCVGILEPRKNQGFLLEVCDELWRGGLDFELHLVGRVNPHFGKPIVTRLKQLAKRHRGRVVWHEGAGDSALVELYGRARATVFPTIAEGCGLPLLESLWMDVPCVCSDLPVLRENTSGGGCLRVPVNDAVAWRDAIRHVVTEDTFIARLRAEAASRPLPTWADTAQQLRAALHSAPPVVRPRRITA